MVCCFIDESKDGFVWVMFRFCDEFYSFSFLDRNVSLMLYQAVLLHNSILDLEVFDKLYDNVFFVFMHYGSSEVMFFVVPFTQGILLAVYSLSEHILLKVRITCSPCVMVSSIMSVLTITLMLLFFVSAVFIF